MYTHTYVNPLQIYSSLQTELKKLPFQGKSIEDIKNKGRIGFYECSIDKEFKNPKVKLKVQYALPVELIISEYSFCYEPGIIHVGSDQHPHYLINAIESDNVTYLDLPSILTVLQNLKDYFTELYSKPLKAFIN